MSRKKARNANSSAGNCSKSSSAESTAYTPGVTWEELLGRAQAALDEHGLEKQAKREKTAEKYLALLAKREITPTWDLEGVKRALAAYFCDIVLGEGRPKGFRGVFASEGVVVTDLWDSMDAYPEIRLVYEYILRQMKRSAEASAQELVGQAQRAQERLVTEDGCDLNQRAVELSLKATMRGVYGDGEKDGGASDAKRGISYSFPNMTVNWIVSPAELGKRVEAKPQPEVIDV